MTNSQVDPALMSPLALAYVGDAVFEIYIREHLVRQGTSRVDELHRQAVAFVRADAQAAALRAVMDRLSEEELAIWKRGRNAKGSVPRSADVTDYRSSTGLEALVGYMYLSGQHDRLDEVMEAVISVREEQIDSDA